MARASASSYLEDVREARRVARAERELRLKAVEYHQEALEELRELMLLGLAVQRRVLEETSEPGDGRGKGTRSMLALQIRVAGQTSGQYRQFLAKSIGLGPPGSSGDAETEPADDDGVPEPVRVRLGAGPRGG